MPQKHLILIHGRAIKPARSPMRKLAKRAILEGLRRADAGDIGEIFGGRDDGDIKFSFAYYGNISNRLHIEAGHEDADLLADIGDGSGEKAFPIKFLERDFDHVRKIEPFNSQNYRRVLQEAKDFRLKDELADGFSLFGSVFTGGAFNTWLVRYAKPDMGQYLRSKEVGSEIRFELRKYLDTALKRGDDICIVAHSMGSMVAYDQLWKCCFSSEYRSIQEKNSKVNLFLTIGCPLGEPGVRLNLLDASWPREEHYPRNIRKWSNFYAEDDYISHVEELHNVFHGMLDKGYVEEIEDQHVFNCWSYRDAREDQPGENSNLRRVSNPHDFYGYLMNAEVAGRIAKWARGQ